MSPQHREKIKPLSVKMYCMTETVYLQWVSVFPQCGHARCDTTVSPVRVSSIFFHTSASPLFFAALSAERWIVCSVSSSGDLRGIEIAFMSPSLSDKCTLMHMPFQNMPSASDRFSLNRGQSCSSISGNLRRPFLVKSDLRSSRQEDWILKMYFFAFSCNTLACEHKNKMFEWFCICSEGSMPPSPGKHNIQRQ